MTRRRRIMVAALLAAVPWAWTRAARAEPPAPTLETVFPAGGRAGTTVEVTVTSNNVPGVRELVCSAPDVQCKLLAPGRFELTLPAQTPPGLYDLWAQCDTGVSSPRSFFVSQRAEHLEAEPNDSPSPASPWPLDVVINGCLEKPGDQDGYFFEARRGQRIVIECWAERIDSRARVILELFDEAGRRVAVNRGYFGIDALIDFRVKTDGRYRVQLHDLTSGGSAEHYYRLDIDTGPRVAFSVPSVVTRDKASKITLYGWNLVAASDSTPTADWDRVDVEIPAEMAHATWPLPLPLQCAQSVLEGFAYQYQGGHAPIFLGVSDLPVVIGSPENHTRATAHELAVPCEVSARLGVDDACDWYAFQARRGEVLYLDVLAQRLDSALDVQMSVLDAAGEQELAQFSDDARDLATPTVSTSHLDPSGRFVAPADGRYLVAIRNLIGGVAQDSRRNYRLRLRREEPDFELLVVPRSINPTGLRVARLGREAFDVVALRRRGLDGGIRVHAVDLPEGVECPDVFLGPGVDRTCMVLAASAGASDPLAELRLEATAEMVPVRQARGATVVRAGRPNPWGRVTSRIPFAIVGEAPLRIVADGHVPLDHHLYGELNLRYCPGSIIDVAVRVERREVTHQASVKLIGEGLPLEIQNQTAEIPAGQEVGYVSFYLPPSLALGEYSFVVRAETTASVGGNSPETVVAYSNPVTFEVQRAAFQVEVQPFGPTRVKRGQVIQVAYHALRRNGFIGKIHTELAAPGCVTNVPGLRARGETFVGQADHGSLQIIVNPDAPLGQLPFLRLFSVGVLEDQPIYHGASFLSLEVVE